MSADPFIEGLILDAFTRQSERDKQVALGPSEVGACAYCVGHTLAQKLPNPPAQRGKGFGYAAHIGTMCHYWLEHNLQLGPEYTQHHEEKLFVGELEGYGPIKGSCDLYVPEIATTFDWKFPGKWSYDKLKTALAKGRLAESRGEPIEPRLHLPSSQYRYQQQLYAHGQKLLGRPIESCVIVFFPRHSNNIDDVIMYQESYQPQMVEAAFDRLETLWGWVQAGELDEIDSEPDCYTCTTFGR